MTPDPSSSPPAASRLLAVLAAPLLLAWVAGIAHPIVDWAAVPGAWLAGLPAGLGPLGLLAVALPTAALAVGSGRDSRTERALATALGLAGGAAAVAVLAAGGAANRPGAWLAVLLSVGALSRHGPTPRADAWSARGRWELVLPVALWIAAMRMAPWGPGLLPEPVHEAMAAGLDSIAVGAIPYVPLLPIAIVGALLARRAPPRRWGAAVGVLVAVGLEKTFGSAEHWVGMAALGALFGAWPPRLLQARTLADWVVPTAVGVALSAALLGITERWNCAAGSVAATDRAEFTWFHTESSGTALAVVPSNLPSLLVLRKGGVLERLQSGIVSGTAEVAPPGGILVTPPETGMPILRLISVDGELVIEWWDAGSMQQTARRVLEADCTPVGGTLEIGTHRAWAACDEGIVIVADPLGEAPAQTWSLGGRPRTVSLVGDALALFGTGPLPRADVHRIPGMKRVARRTFGPWSAGLAESPRRVAVGRGPAGHVEIFGSPHVEDRPEGGSYADELARALRTSTDSVRVGNWPGTVHRAQVGDRNRGWFESVWVGSPVDARLTLVDLDATWHQRSVPIGAPIRAMWVDPRPGGSLYGLNRCGVFSLRLRTTFPWDP